ncbi:MAG: hypothetical protein AAGJ54_05835 [Planctomycetota bacterium]
MATPSKPHNGTAAPAGRNKSNHCATAESARLTAATLRERLRQLGEMQDLIREHGPLVTKSHAAEILGVDRRRMIVLERQGRLTVIRITTSERVRQFVPVKDLYHAPTPVETGKPRGRHVPSGEYVRDDGNHKGLVVPRFRLPPRGGDKRKSPAEWQAERDDPNDWKHKG